MKQILRHLQRFFLILPTRSHVRETYDHLAAHSDIASAQDLRARTARACSCPVWYVAEVVA